MGRFGILGGTFNPIHLGHLLLAEWAREILSLDEVWFIPAGVPYLKSDRHILPGGERLFMTELAVRDTPYFKCLDLEVRRAGVTYSYETLEQLKAQHPEDSLFFIVGADCFFSIENWKHPQKIFDSCTLAAAMRGDISIAQMKERRRELAERFQADIQFLPFLPTTVSSSFIRECIRGGRSVRYLVPDDVRKYIEEKGYYREQ